jgi:hypothetical protein
MLFIAQHCTAGEPAPELLSNRLQAFAGIGSNDCGSIPLGNVRSTTLECAKRAISSGSAFRVAIQYQGVDSFIWQGAAGDGHGKLWVLFYDSMGPTLNVKQCSAVTFASIHGRDDIECHAASHEP